MRSITSGRADGRRRRRRLATAVKESQRELSVQLSLLNHQVGTHIELKDADFHCLNQINRHVPLSPTALARRAGLHPGHHDDQAGEQHRFATPIDRRPRRTAEAARPR